MLNEPRRKKSGLRGFSTRLDTNQALLSPGFTVTEESLKLEILDTSSGGLLLSV